MPPTARHLHQAIPYPPVAMPAVRNVMGCGLGFSVGHRILDMEGSRIAMTDELRARIAAVLAEAQETHNGISDLALADAVIRELEAVPQRIMLSHASQAAESNRLDAADWLERELASVGLECGAGWVLYHLVDGVVARLNGAVDE